MIYTNYGETDLYISITRPFVTRQERIDAMYLFNHMLNWCYNSVTGKKALVNCAVQQGHIVWHFGKWPPGSREAERFNETFDKPQVTK